MPHSRSNLQPGGRDAPQLLLSDCVNTHLGLAAVPHCVVPPVQEKRHCPRLQMVMALGSVGQTLPHLPLRHKPGGLVPGEAAFRQSGPFAVRRHATRLSTRARTS